jgi:beta-glucanase (GH16 family)
MEPSVRRSVNAGFAPDVRPRLAMLWEMPQSEKDTMKRRLAFTFSILLMTVAVARAGNWKLVWSDEFNYQGLPDPAKWDYEEGFVRNHELQYYTRGRLENARVENGMLVLECRKEHFVPPHHAPVNYTSASIHTQKTAHWKYGRIEVRAKIPSGAGVWPAIWTLGADRRDRGWPDCGEIDIMEFIGRAPDKIHGTIHYGLDGKPRQDTGSLTTPRPYDDFHVYAVEWYPDRIDFYFDKQKYRSVSLDQAGKGESNPFRQPHYLKINFALGGDWGGAVDDAILPQKFLIDYVRVYSDANH